MRMLAAQENDLEVRKSLLMVAESYDRLHLKHLGLTQVHPDSQVIKLKP